LNSSYFKVLLLLMYRNRLIQIKTLKKTTKYTARQTT